METTSASIVAISRIARIPAMPAIIWKPKPVCPAILTISAIIWKSILSDCHNRMERMLSEIATILAIVTIVNDHIETRLRARSCGRFLRIRFLLVPKIRSCEHIKYDLPTHGSVILTKTDVKRACSIFIRHSS